MIHNIPDQGSTLAACDANPMGKSLTSPLCDVEIDPSIYGDTRETEEKLPAARAKKGNHFFQIQKEDSPPRRAPRWIALLFDVLR